MGQLLKFFGEDRAVFGSDGVWYGSPQCQIEALWRFQIPDEMCRQYGYPKLTETAKRKILGLNSARNYKLPIAGVGFGGPYKPVPKDYETLLTPQLKTILEFPGYAADDLGKLKQAYLETGGAPDNMRYGWMRRG